MRNFNLLRLAAALCVGALAIGGLAQAQEGKEVKVGDKAPEFTAKDDAGKEWKSTDVVGKKIVVVYFYPANFTGGCTKQACAFRDDFKKLKDKGVEVIGVSGDDVKSHAAFKKYHELTFTLLSDYEGDIAKKFGVPANKGGDFKFKEKDFEITVTTGVRINRWTFVIGKDGKIIYKDTKVNAAGDSKKILEFVEKLDK